VLVGLARIRVIPFRTAASGDLEELAYGYELVEGVIDGGDADLEETLGLNRGSPRR
jgi:hypothetical protein